MFNSTTAGLVVQALLFLPLMPAKPGSGAISLRFCLRFLVMTAFIYVAGAHVYERRGSPLYRPWLLLAMVTGAACLLTAAITELHGRDVPLKDYHDLLLSNIESKVAIIFCFRQIANLISPIKGPILAKLTSLWKVYHLVRGTYDHKVAELHDKYGDIVRVGPYEYSIGSYTTYFQFAHALPHLDPLFISHSYLGQGFSISEPIRYLPGDDKTMMQHAYHHESSIDECNSILLRSLSEYAHRAEPIQLTRLISSYAWDVMGATTVGQCFGFMDMREELTTIMDRIGTWKIFAILEDTFFRFHPWLTAITKSRVFQDRYEEELNQVLIHTVLQRLGRRLGKPGDEATEETSEFDPYARWFTLIEKSPFAAAYDMFRGRVPEADEKASFLGTMVALLLVGSDPIAGHIMSTIFYLSCDPAIVHKLRHELAQLEIPLSNPPTLQELIDRKQDLPYLGSVLCEAQRLRNKDGFNFTRLAGSQEAAMLLGGHTIPDHCTIRLSTQAAERNKAFLENSADEFVPERWLGHVEPLIAALGQETGDEETRRGLVAKIIVQIVQLFDITLSNPAPSPTSSMALAAARFSFNPSIGSQLAAAGIHPKSAMADHVGHIRRHLGDQCLRTILEARASNEFTASQKYSTLHGLRTEPISDNNDRKPLHQAIEAISKGALESKTDHDDKCITLGGAGFGSYVKLYRRNARAQEARDRERGFDRGRGHGRGRGRGRGRGYFYEHGRKRFDDRSNTSRRSNDPSVTAADPRISGWNNFSASAKNEDRAANEAANARVDAMVRKQEADDNKFVVTYKKTTIVNGVRTTVDVLKNGESERGGVTLPQQAPEKRSTSPPKLPSSYVPPHKRVNAISPEKAALSGTVGDKVGDGVAGNGDKKHEHNGTPTGHHTKASDSKVDAKDPGDGSTSGLGGDEGKTCKANHRLPSTEQQTQSIALRGDAMVFKSSKLDKAGTDGAGIDMAFGNAKGNTGVLEQSSAPQNKISQFQAETGGVGEPSTPQHKLDDDG